MAVSPSPPCGRHDSENKTLVPPALCVVAVPQNVRSSRRARSSPRASRTPAGRLLPLLCCRRYCVFGGSASGRLSCKDNASRHGAGVPPFSRSSGDGSFHCFHLVAGRDCPGASGRIRGARGTAWGATLLARTDCCPSPQHERRLGVCGHLGLHSHEHRRALHGLGCGVGPDGAIRCHLCVLVEP